MANRTVSVELVAKTEGYTVPIIAAKDETERFDEKVKKSNEDVDKLGKTSVKTAAELKLLGLEADAAKLKLNDTGKGAATSLELVNQKLVETRAKVKAFAEEFNRTGSVDSLNLWKQATKDLGDLEKFKKNLTGALSTGVKDATPAVEKEVGNWMSRASKSFVDGLANAPWVGAIFKPLSDAMASLPPPVQIAIGAGIAGAILASASFIGAALNGVLMAGVGLGGIAVGIVGQIHDPAVVAAFSQFKTSVGVALTNATSAFGPGIAAALDTGRSGLVTFLAAIKPGLDALAPVLNNLVAGFVNGLNGAAPEFVKAFREAAPLLNELAADLPGLIHTIGEFFSITAGGSAGAKDGLRALLATVEALILGIGFLIRGLSDSFHTLTVAFHGLHDIINGNIINDFAMMGSAGNIVAGMGDKVKVAAEAVAKAAAAARGGATDFQSLTSALSQTQATADTVAGAMTDKLLNSLLAGDHATLSFDESLTKLSESVAQNGRQLDIHTKAGQANREAVLAVVAANLQTYNTMIAAGASAKDAAAAYDQNTKALQDQLRQAGFTSGQIDDLIGKYKSVPDKVNTTIALEGLTDAVNNLTILLGAINKIPRYVSIEAAITAVDNSGLAQNVSPHDPGRKGNRYGGIYEHAETGLLSAGIYPPSSPARYAFAEPATGGEAFIPRNGDMNRSRGIWEYVGANWLGARPSGGGGGAVRVELAFTGAAAGSLGSVIMGMVRTGEIQIKTSQLVPS